jgi:antitoxin (DNA-binding transcriptional repressor) of toxin-antitoxin stability system
MAFGGEIDGESGMCHDVHMLVITIRDLHLNTGRWVRRAASGEPVIVTDRGRRVATLAAVTALPPGRPLPDREARIRRRSRLPVDSSRYVSEMRDRR